MAKVEGYIKYVHIKCEVAKLSIRAKNMEDFDL
jgi:hypothetical protein